MPSTMPAVDAPSYPNGPVTVAPHLMDRELLISAMEKAGGSRQRQLTPRQVGYALRRHRMQVKKI